MDHDEHDEPPKSPQHKQKTPSSPKFAPAKRVQFKLGSVPRNALKPAALPTPKAAGKPVVKLAEKTTEKPVVKLAEKATEKPVVKLAEKTTEKPAQKHSQKHNGNSTPKQPAKPTVVPPSKPIAEPETPQTPITDHPEEELITSPTVSTTPRPAQRYIASTKELTAVHTAKAPAKPKREKFTLNVEDVDADFKRHLETKAEEVLKMMDAVISCCQSNVDAIERAMDVREIFLLVLISLITSSKQQPQQPRLSRRRQAITLP